MARDGAPRFYILGTRHGGAVINSPYGSLKTLMVMLTATPALSGISLVFGEENINAQEFPLPMVVMVPVGGTWGPPGTPGYYKNASPDLNNIWMTQETIDLYLWNNDPDAEATEVDHADAVEDLRARVLQALQSQSPQGLMYRPVSGRWQLADKENNRFGRAYVLTVSVDITIPDTLPVLATIEEVTVNGSLQESV